MDHIWQGDQFGEQWFTAQDVYCRMVANCRPDGKLVEVGCWKGRSTAFLCVEAYNKSKRIRVYAVDTWKGSHEHRNDPSVQGGTLYEQFLQNTLSVGHRLTSMQMTSHAASRWFNDQSLDAVFIDASHNYEDVGDDILAWRGKVRPGGILAGHDYCPSWPGVQKAVNELIKNFEIIGQSWLSIC